jgi:TolB-like protein/Tfp pilus assembly protein PilF
LPTRSRRWNFAIAAAAVALLVLGVWSIASRFDWHEPPDRVETKALPLPDQPSIAVLPFDNLSGEGRFDHLANGLTEDITTDLSRFRDLFVIARNSTEAYQDRAVDVRIIARELGVHYVVEGSLRADDQRARITAQLIDGASGSHLWSEQYDRPLADVFKVQNEVTQAIAGSLAGYHGVLANAVREAARRKPPNNLQAYEYYSLGIEHKHHFTQPDNTKAREFFQKAIDLEPEFARAHTGLAWTHLLDIDFAWTTSREQSLAKMLAAVRDAIALDPYDSEAHMALASHYQYLNDFRQTIAEIDRSLELNPNSANQLAQAAWILTRAGQPERSLGLMERAIRLDPYYADWYAGAMRETYFYNHQFEATIAAINRRLYPEPIWDPLYRAMSYAQLGQAESAAAEAEKVFVDQPDFSAEKWINDTGTFARKSEFELLVNSIKKAGLPTCAAEEQLAKYPDMNRLPECELHRAGS